MSVLQTHPAFTRVGPQCAVCSAWRKPCPRCLAGAPAAVVSEGALMRTLIGTEQPIAEEMATDIVRTGAVSERLNRAKEALGLADAS